MMRFRPKLLLMVICAVVVYIVCTNRPWDKEIVRGVADYVRQVNVNHRETCYQEFKFAETPLNVTALASFPRSGNTWTRRMLTEATGIYTGTVYPDPRPAGDLLYPPSTPIINGSVIVVKTHNPEDANALFQRAILLLRNPFDCLASEFCRLRGATKCLKALNRTEPLTSFLSLGAHNWYKFYTSWFRLRGPLLIIMYEDLITAPETELRKMLNFLGFSDKRIHCAIDKLPLKLHSTMTPERVRQLYTPEQIQQIETYREKVFHMANMTKKFSQLNSSATAITDNHLKTILSIR